MGEVEAPSPPAIRKRSRRELTSSDQLKDLSLRSGQIFLLLLRASIADTLSVSGPVAPTSEERPQPGVAQTGANRQTGLLPVVVAPPPGEY